MPCSASVRILCALIFTGLCLLASTPAKALDLSVAVGRTNHGEATLNAAVFKPFRLALHTGPAGRLYGYWAAGLTWWEADRFGSDEYSISLSPVFGWEFTGPRLRPFVEAGIGAGYFTANEVGDRRIGSRLHFEDRFGAGVHLGERSRLQLRVIHYSNAGLKKPNQGINSWSLVYSYRL